MWEYHDLLERVVTGGYEETQRAKVNGESVTTTVRNGESIRIPLNEDYFPLVTLKKTS